MGFHSDEEKECLEIIVCFFLNRAFRSVLFFHHIILFLLSSCSFFFFFPFICVCVYMHALDHMNV